MSQAVHDRILAVRDQWLSFCEEEKGRILCWQIGGDGYDVLRAFLEFEAGEQKELPHLFVPLQTPFQSGSHHEAKLLEELETYIQDLAQAEEDPEDLPSASSQRFLANALLTIQKHDDGLIEIVAASIFPKDLQPNPEWTTFLREQLEHENWPPSVRFMVLDSLEEPTLDQLKEDFPDSFFTEELTADIAEIAQEIAHENPATGPGPDFQKAYADLNAATAKGNPKDAKAAGKKADAIAEKENWPGMRVAVSLNLGASSLKEDDDVEALNHYRQAEKHAQTAKKAEEPGADKLIFQALLSQASVHFKNQRYSHACDLYERGAAIVEELEKEEIMMLDCWRMASFCQEQLITHREIDPVEKLTPDEHLDQSWGHAHKGLKAAEAIEEDQRKETTLAYLGAAMLRLVEHSILKGQKTKLEGKLEKIMGADWRKQVEEVTP